MNMKLKWVPETAKFFFFVNSYMIYSTIKINWNKTAIVTKNVTTSVDFFKHNFQIKPVKNVRRKLFLCLNRGRPRTAKMFNYDIFIQSRVHGVSCLVLHGKCM